MQPEQPQGNWTYRNEVDAPYGDPQTPKVPSQTVEPVSWTASEFIAHHKDGGWYAAMAGGSILFGIVVYLITRDLISVISIGIVVILFLIISAKKPQQRTFAVDNLGISVDDKFYPFDSFKSFSITSEGAINSIIFMPLKRLMPELTVYYPPEDEDRIISVLSVNLPNDQKEEKKVDRLMKRLRF